MDHHIVESPLKGEFHPPLAVQYGIMNKYFIPFGYSIVSQVNLLTDIPDKKNVSLGLIPTYTANFPVQGLR